jgi:hypothetical protein
MLLTDNCERLKKSINFQIFATDLDEHALAIARKGSYPKASLVEVPKAFRERYFNVIDDRFQVKPALRDIVIFAKHNVDQDPPFLNLDLVSCRRRGWGASRPTETTSNSLRPWSRALRRTRWLWMKTTRCGMSTAMPARS